MLTLTPSLLSDPPPTREKGYVGMKLMFQIMTWPINRHVSSSTKRTGWPTFFDINNPSTTAPEGKTGSLRSVCVCVCADTLPTHILKSNSCNPWWNDTQCSVFNVKSFVRFIHRFWCFLTKHFCSVCRRDCRDSKFNLNKAVIKLQLWPSTWVENNRCELAERLCQNFHINDVLSRCSFDCRAMLKLNHVTCSGGNKYSWLYLVWGTMRSICSQLCILRNSLN